MGEWEYNLKGSLVQEKEGLFTDECCSAWPAEVKTWSLSSAFIYPKHDSSQSKWTCPRTHTLHFYTLLCEQWSVKKSHSLGKSGPSWTNSSSKFFDDFFDFKGKIIKETEGHWETYIEWLSLYICVHIYTQCHLKVWDQ